MNSLFHRSIALAGLLAWPMLSLAQDAAVLPAETVAATAEVAAPAMVGGQLNLFVLILHASLPVQFVMPGRNGRTFDRLEPVAALARAADGLGHVNPRIDRDGSVRAVALCFAAGDRRDATPHIIALGRPAAISPDCAQPRRLHFAAPESFATVSFVSVSESTYSISTLAWLCRPAWRKASLSDL